MRIVVVTNNQLGWDCVCGAYKSFDAAVRDLNDNTSHDNTQEDYESDGYVFSEVTVKE